MSIAGGLDTLPGIMSRIARVAPGRVVYKMLNRGSGRRRMLPAAMLLVVVCLMGVSGAGVGAQEIGVEPRFEEHRVEFHNGAVKLAGSLLTPTTGAPTAAVVFVHGAGPQTREPYREIGEFFAARGIAALIYDKRGAGQSSGAYESREPYKNLVDDALAGVAFLKQRGEIAPSQIGIWGLSQGAYISAAAAARTEDIKFVIVVGADVADGMMFYYRDNLFRRFGLSGTLRDVAEKAYLAQQSLPFISHDGVGLSAFAPRTYPPPGKYVHPAWSGVHQPVLAMWGQLDQHIPVGESVVGLKNSLGRANNENWTFLILPRANHDLGVSETGELHSKWRGYAPGALETMTDWARSAIDHPAEIDKMKQTGVALDAGVLPKLARYERLRWYGNGTVQAALLILFLVSFLTNTIAGVRHGVLRLFRHQQSVAVPVSNKVTNWKRVIGAINLLILAAFSITELSVLDQIRPSCPAVLRYLPLLGALSALATVALLIVLAGTLRQHNWTRARTIRWSLDVLCFALFVPYLFYWDLIGFRF